MWPWWAFLITAITSVATSIYIQVRRDRRAKREAKESGTFTINWRVR